jgi:hypothetical protein
MSKEILMSMNIVFLCVFGSVLLNGGHVVADFFSTAIANLYRDASCLPKAAMVCGFLALCHILPFTTPILFEFY